MDLNNLNWRKASKSGGNGGDCVQVTTIEAGQPGWDEFVAERASHKPGESKYFLVRDSKLNDHSPVLAFTQDEWAAFIDGVKKNEFEYETLISV